MRDLKFRAWDVESECYIDETDWAGITPEGQNIWLVEEEEVSVLPILGEFIIEQYTGLKDKNGKEIYDGDIIRVQNGEYTRLSAEEKTDGSEVVFEWGAFRYLADNGLTKNTMEHLFPYNLEVIGNIHENKELLKGEE